ncbi:MAG: ribonuclease R [Clostridiales Family XIII bacterium]|jgi:ribonuclease R|nr:ribonuclease R [Clostridiales Family XIII bacterium]
MMKANRKGGGGKRPGAKNRPGAGAGAKNRPGAKDRPAAGAKDRPGAKNRPGAGAGAKDRRQGRANAAGRGAKAGAPKAEQSVIGVLQKTRRGFGFVIQEEQEGGDVFIPASRMEGAMNGDRVRATLFTSSGNGGRRGPAAKAGDETRPQRREGRIAEILERAVSRVVGTFEWNRRYGIVTPDDRNEQAEIFIGRSDCGGAEPGDKVVVEIVKYPGPENSAEGRVEEIVARAGEPGGDILAMLRGAGLTKEFPPAVLAEAGAVAAGPPEGAADGRRDLRGESVVTIDGMDSKDFDDAVSIRRTEGGYLLGVHIADVSHYVREGGALDGEALKRGASVYLLDQVAPMLPESLSNGICSLNEGVDRLTLSIDMLVGADGEVQRHEIYESVIRSRARLVYTDISELLEKGDPALMEKYSGIYEDLLAMAELAEILRKKRDARGSIDFDLDEAVIKLNEEGIPVQVSVAERRTANRLIEEFMLLANETVAEDFCGRELPFIYRIHQKPDADKLHEFDKFLGGFGLSLDCAAENPRPAAFNRLLEKIRGRPEENVVNTVMLRSMKKAFYGTGCDGHFGLAVKYYCHFTSPIRRYPDLVIHRIIKESLRGAISDERRGDLEAKAEHAAERSSEMERKILELERDVEKMKKAEYMSYHIGEVEDAVISGVTSFGFFAELANTVEGLVHVESLADDYYVFEPEKYRLIGERTKKAWALGDPVRIRVASVDLYSKEVNFVVEEEKRR